MESRLSPVIAIFFMKKQPASNSASPKLKEWYQYVDECIRHLESWTTKTFKNSSYTMEAKENNQVALLDVSLTRK